MLEVRPWPPNPTELPVLPSPTKPPLSPFADVPRGIFPTLVACDDLQTCQPSLTFLVQDDKQRYGNSIFSCLSLELTTELRARILLFLSQVTARNSNEKSDRCLLSMHVRSRRLAAPAHDGSFLGVGTILILVWGSQNVHSFLNLHSYRIKIRILCQVNQTSIKLIERKQKPNVIIPQNGTRLPLCSDNSDVLTPSS